MRGKGKHRILRMITSLPEGGVERLMCQILPRLNQSGFEVMVACTDELGKLAPVLEKQGVEVMVQRVRSRFHPVDIYRLVRQIRERGIGLVHTHMYASSIPGVIAARQAGVPVVVQVHSLHEWQRPNRIRMCRYFFRRADRVLAVSESIRQSLMRHCRLEPQMVTVLYNGVDLDRFSHPHVAPGFIPGQTSGGQAPALQNANETRQQWGINPQEIVVGSVARLVPVKGLFDLVQAAAIARKSCPELCLVLVGGGDLRSELEAEARKLELRAVFTGTQEDVRPFIDMFDLAVLSSHSEGFGNSLLEAMAASLPIVATRVGGIPEIVTPETGLLVPPKDPQALAQAILKLAGDKDMQKRMGSAGRKRVEDVFSLEKTLSNTIKLYQEILT